MKDYITAEIIAEEIGVTPKTVREWLKSGELVGIKVGNGWRVHRTDFNRYIEGQRLEALLLRARNKHPDTDWEEGQCRECGENMATPKEKASAWVCSSSCKTNHDHKWANILGTSDEQYAYNCATVIPHF